MLQLSISVGEVWFGVDCRGWCFWFLVSTVVEARTLPCCLTRATTLKTCVTVGSRSALGAHKTSTGAGLQARNSNQGGQRRPSASTSCVIGLHPAVSLLQIFIIPSSRLFLPMSI